MKMETATTTTTTSKIANKALRLQSPHDVNQNTRKRRLKGRDCLPLQFTMPDQSLLCGVSTCMSLHLNLGQKLKNDTSDDGKLQEVLQV